MLCKSDGNTRVGIAGDDDPRIQAKPSDFVGKEPTSLREGTIATGEFTNTTLNAYTVVVEYIISGLPNKVPLFVHPKVDNSALFDVPAGAIRFMPKNYSLALAFTESNRGGVDFSVHAI